jgi:crossover junction endodeoxyribonuclease RuvC
MFVLGVDLGTNLGIAVLDVSDPSKLSTYTRRLESDYAGRLEGLRKELEAYNRSDCAGVVIEEPFGANKAALRVLYGMMGVAVDTCERLGMPYYVENLARLKKFATGKGNAKKPDMIEAARRRWGVELAPDEADAAHCAAYGVDKGLFG